MDTEWGDRPMDASSAASEAVLEVQNSSERPKSCLSETRHRDSAVD